MSQGILTSADSAAFSVTEISVRESQISRTSVNITRVETIPWNDTLRVKIRNTGLDKLAGFEKWDVIFQYFDSGGEYHANWLPYTAGTPGDNEWTVADIWHGGPNEFFEPDILDPQEELVIIAKLNPLAGDATSASVTVITPNGVYDSQSFDNHASVLLVPHSEMFSIGQLDYFELVGGVLDDGPAVTDTSGTIGRRQTGRWLLYNLADSSQQARHLFSLNGLATIPAGTWTVYYRGQANGNWPGRSYAGMSIDIIIRQADGTIRQTIAADVANAAFSWAYTWETLSATYDFPGYTVVDDTDLLEIVYYGTSNVKGPSSSSNDIRLKIDDGSLAEADQTRITG